MHIGQTQKVQLYTCHVSSVTLMNAKCRYRVDLPGFLDLVTVMEMCQGCEQDQTRQGCRIQSGVCLCGIGCYSEYRYTTKEECRKALRGYCK